MLPHLQFIFNRWQRLSKACVKGGIAIERGISKLMLQRGFTEIRSLARDLTLEIKLSKGLDTINYTFHKSHLAHYFNMWRRGDFISTKAAITDSIKA